jgi:hypothetical protein
MKRPGCLRIGRYEGCCARDDEGPGGSKPSRPRAHLRHGGAVLLILASGCCSVPPYSPAFWNDGFAGIVQPHNNCYNYGNNKRTDTFAQPGRAAGAMYSMPITCSGIYNAAVADGLKPVSASGSCPCKKDKIAFVVAPCVAPACGPPFYWGNDYHWYRQGTDGMWSHKPGGTAATNVDVSSNPIPNPETANRCSPGLCYSEFCGYFCSCSDSDQGQGHENIN